MEKLIDYYSQILKSFGLTVDEDGSVSHQFMGEITPMKVKDKPLIVPSRNLLSKPLPENKVVFHPLSENVARGGESEVLKAMRNVVELQMFFYLSTLMRHLAHFATDSGPKLTGRQASYLKPIQDADEKFVKFIENVIEASDVRGQDRIVKCFMARTFSLNGTTYTRACVVKFPILTQAVDENKDRVFGVKYPRKKDRTLLINLMQIILDGYGLDDEYYSDGSSSATAPYWDALLGSYLKLSDRINTVLKVFGKHIPDTHFVPPMHTKYIDTSEWHDEIIAMYRLRDSIPPMPFNTGLVEEVLQRPLVKGIPSAPPHQPQPASQEVAPHQQPPTNGDAPPWETPQQSAPTPMEAPHQVAPAPSYGYGSVGVQAAPAADPYSMDSLMAIDQQARFSARIGQYGGMPGIYNAGYQGWS